MINAILCVFFILITISVVGICSYVYAGKPERKNGMILGMHVPDDAVLDDSLLALTRAYLYSFWRSTSALRPVKIMYTVRKVRSMKRSIILKNIPGRSPL